MKHTTKIEFSPGCFDEFEGTQEELDELILHIKKFFENINLDELDENEDIVDLEELSEEDPDLYIEILSSMNNRTLH